MARSEGLAKGAGVIGIGGFVGHALDTDVPLAVDRPRFLLHLFYLIFLGIELHLYLIEDTPEVLVQLGMEDIADVVQLKALLHRLLGDSYPGDISLPDMHHPLGVIDEVVNLAL